MKLKFLWMLLIAAGFSLHMYAQNQVRLIESTPRSEMIFNTPQLRSSNVFFDFNLSAGQRVQFEMLNRQQLNVVPNLDSLFALIKQTLKPLQDSFKADGLVRRVDFATNKNFPPRIRISTHTQRPTTYTYINNELMQLKIDSDTIRIQLNTPSSKLTKFIIADTVSMRAIAETFIIKIILNNIADIDALPDATLSQCLSMVKRNVSMESPIKESKYYSASFDMKQEKLLYISKIRPGEFTQPKGFSETIRLGLQYARGSFLPSAGVGVQYILNNNYNDKHIIRLMWEPYFYFERGIDNKVITHRNDFITAQYTQLYKNTDLNKLQLTGHFSLGYLAGRQGNLFEKNTFKLGLPIFVYQSLRIEPEFFFNKFFKGFSPSIKVVLMLE